MKHLIILFLVFTTYGSLAQQGEWLWVKEHFSSATFVTEQADDGFLLYGPYESELNWTDPPLTSFEQDWSSYMVQYAGNGEWAWFNCHGYDALYGYATTKDMLACPSGNIYANHMFHPIYCFAGDTFVESGFTANKPETILAKYSPSGELLWHQRFHKDSASVTQNMSRVGFICTDEEESIYASGSFLGTIVIGDTTLTMAGNNSPTFLCKFDSAGNFNWLSRFYGVGWDGERVRYNPVSKRIEVTGRVDNDDCIFGSDTLYAPNYPSTYFVSINSANGQVEDIRTYPGYPLVDNELHFMDINQQGEHYFTNYLQYDTLHINGELMAFDLKDFLLWKTKANGDVIWAKQFTGDGQQYAYELQVHSSGDIFMSLSCQNMLVIDTDTVFNHSGNNTGILQLDSAGNYKSTIGVIESEFSSKSFTFIENDLIVYGQSRGDSIGICPIDDCFLGRFHLGNIGIEEVELEVDELVMIYPNPASSQLKIESSFTISQISVYSITGQLVKEQAANGKMVSLNVSDLLPGNYIIRGIGANQDFARKFVVLR